MADGGVIGVKEVERRRCNGNDKEVIDEGSEATREAGKR